MSDTQQEFKLCYIEDNYAFFTTKPLDTQWGDDWNDAPYEHNAGYPYAFDAHDRDRGYKPWCIMSVEFICHALKTPRDGYLNSPYTVQGINKKEVPWLSNETTQIWAGCSIGEFTKLIKEAGGAVATGVIED
ncbi:hypothetical protein KC887_09365 [Candidatus Kaiserbacteria bacterium]|nr:hypothetical protein [Candidatus Kaiserbacteria bacterium]